MTTSPSRAASRLLLSAVRLWSVLLFTLCLLFGGSPATQAWTGLTLPASAEGEVTPPEQTRVLEFLPLYKFKNSPGEAVHALYSTLAELGITEENVTITVLGFAPDKLAVTATPDQVAIVKQVLASIDPAPQPAPQPQQVEDLYDSIRVAYLAPEALWTAMDQVMFNFLDFKRFDPGTANLVVYAKGDGSESRLTFYIPNPELVAAQFATRTQGYHGYTVHVRATNKERAILDTLKTILLTIDQPATSKRYDVIEVHYLEIAEALNSLRAAGYTAIYTKDEEKMTDAVMAQIQSGASPVIYSAPSIEQDTVDVSTSLSNNNNSGVQRSQFKVLTFDSPVSGSDIHRLVIFGSDEEIAAVKAYIELIDVPAKQMMIEAQIVEINVDGLSDLGLRSVAGKDDIISSITNPRFPGEAGTSGTSLSPSDSANFFTYDDAALPAGSFQAQLASLILEGKASIKARPKVVTVDGRQAIISIVRQVPVAQETFNASNDRSTFEINYIPVGITLNIKPRVGEGNSEVQMLVNAVVSNVGTINNVVSGINLQAPELNTREVSTFARVPNHRSLILGGLISNETEERTFKTPILGDIPVIGELFRRTRKNRDRTEIMIIITPHIIDETGGRTDETDNPYLVNDIHALPKGSPVFDALDNLLGQATYILKLPDIKGVDPVTREPLSYESEDPPLGAVDDPVFLTLAGVVRKLALADELGLTDLIQPPKDWAGPMTPFEKRRIAESFLIGYIIESNGLNIAGLTPGREITIPSTSTEEHVEAGFVGEQWSDLTVRSFTPGSLYDTILQSLRALDYTTDEAAKRGAH